MSVLDNLFAVPHAGFVAAAYAITGAVLAGTVAAVLLDGRAQRRALDRLSGAAEMRADRRGARR